MKCPDCNGKGKWLGLQLWHKCKTCNGTGMLEPDDPFDVMFDEDFAGDGIPLPVLDDITEPLWAFTLAPTSKDTNDKCD